MLMFKPGTRVKTSRGPEVYLIDPEGYKRWIPNPDVYNKLFRSWDGIVADDAVANITTGPPLSLEAKLVKGFRDNVYFFDKPVEGAYIGTYRWIISPATMDKYHFDWNKIVTADQSLIDANTDVRFWA